jgi:hypothetical protein
MVASIDVYVYSETGVLKMALLDLNPSTKIEWIKNAYWAATGVREGSYALSSMDLTPPLQGPLDDHAPAFLSLEDVCVLAMAEVHLRIVPKPGGLKVSHSPVPRSPSPDGVPSGGQVAGA